MASVLQKFITQKGVKSGVDGKHESSFHAAAKAKVVSMQVTGAVQWRAPGLVYKKNEVYLDIVESISVLISPSGQVLRSSATGVIQMKTFLSGMRSSIGLNDQLGAEGAGGAGRRRREGQSRRVRNPSTWRICSSTSAEPQQVRLGEGDPSPPTASST